MQTLALVFVLLGSVAVYAQDGECDVSELGYACKKQMTDYYALHWSLGPTTLGDTADEGEVAMAMVGTTTGWVGVGFPEEAGTMAPADVVLGWVNGITPVVRPYRPTIQNIAEDNADDDVTLTSTGGSQSGQNTTIQFVRSVSGITVDIDIDAETPINVAVGPSDSLVQHAPDRRASSTITLGLAARETDGVAPEIASTDATVAPPTTVEDTSPANATEPEEGGGGGCTPSDLGYDCMMEVSSLITIHWTVGPADETDDAPEISEGEVAMALVGQTAGYVGISFAESPGSMFPADAVIGWVDGSDVTVTPYRIVEQSVADANEDDSIGIRGESGSEEGGVTTISFVWTGEFTFDVDLTSTVDMNWAVGTTDGLAYHGLANKGSFRVNLQSGATEMPEEPEEMPEESGGGTPTTTMMTSSGGGCPPSDLGYSCLTAAGDPVFIHWTLGPAPATDDVPEVMDGEVAIAMVSQTDGWVGVSFAEASGSMAPADAIIGWVTGTGVTVTPYRITIRNVSPGDESTDIGIREESGTEQGGNTIIRFIATGNFTFDVNLQDTINMNWAVGSSDSLMQHSRRGSFAINLLSGAATDTSPTLKYYKAHGSCMIIAWVGLAPLGVIIGRNKYFFMQFGQHVWFWFHRGVQLLAVASMICGLVIALSEFEDPASPEGKRHRRVGISILVIGFVQALIPFFRPHLDSEYRFIFNYVHQWLGRSAVIIGIATVFLGIKAFDLLNDDNVDIWWITCTVILSIYFVITAIGEIFISYKNMQEAQEKLKKKTDAPQPGAVEMT